MCAVQLARYAGARVIGTVRSSAEEPTARSAGAHEVVLNDQRLPERIKALAPEGIDHIVEVAFGANIDADVEMLKMGGLDRVICDRQRDAEDSVLAYGVQKYSGVLSRER